jgi:hypothetical protein
VATTSRGRKQDRRLVAGGQNYEVRYESNKTGKRKKRVKHVGPVDFERVVLALLFGAVFGQHHFLADLAKLLPPILFGDANAGRSTELAIHAER